MPKFNPTPIIQDCWSSIGNITFFHRNGQCFYKRKPYTEYRGTAAQLDQALIHHRAILAWQQLPHSVQLEWRELAKSVPSHRPPYDNQHHISGYNLFASAYHGFAQLGREHVPQPQPFPQFPPSLLELLATTCSNGMANILCRLTLIATNIPERWHISARIQLTAPGVGSDPRKMRTYLATRTAPNEIVFHVPQKETEDYQVHLRYRLIDAMTGYRNNWMRVLGIK